MDCWITDSLAIKKSVGSLARGKDDKLNAAHIAEYAYRFQDMANIYKPMIQELNELKVCHIARQNRIKFLSSEQDQLMEMKYKLKNDPNNSTIKWIIEEIEPYLKIYKEEIDKLDQMTLGLIEKNNK